VQPDDRDRLRRDRALAALRYPARPIGDEGFDVRFTILSDEGERLGTVSFDDGRFDTDDLPNPEIAERIVEHYRDLRSNGGYDSDERLVRATLERVNADTGVRFVRDPADD
jgi:hypothetical protein